MDKTVKSDLMTFLDSVMVTMNNNGVETLDQFYDIRKFLDDYIDGFELGMEEDV